MALQQRYHPIPTGDLAERVIGEIRAELGRTRRPQNSLMHALGVTEGTVSRRLANAERITLGQLEAMCYELQIDPVDLVQRALRSRCSSARPLVAVVETSPEPDLTPPARGHLHSVK